MDSERKYSKNSHVVITGATGFSGAYHVQTFVEAGFYVIGVGRNLDRLHQLQQIYPHHYMSLPIDLVLESKAFAELMREYQPLYVIHLAAQADPGKAYLKPVETIQNNSMATLAVLNAVQANSPHTRVVITTSSYLYGDKEGELHEELLITAKDVYGQTKLMDRILSQAYSLRYGLQIIEAVVFNHLGVGRRIGLHSRIVKQAVEAKIIGRNCINISVGSLKYMRDIQHATDWARASLTLAKKGINAPYNVCFGVGHTLEQFINIVSQEVGIRIDIIEDNSLLTPGTPLATWGNNTKLKTLGWIPWVSFEDLVIGMIEFWYRELSSDKG